MMSKVMKKSTRFFTLSLCIALLITNTLLLAPEVGAASDSNNTKTENITDNNISPAENAELTLRAIAIDEAKKEAEAAVNEQLAIIAQEEEEAAQAAATEAPTEAAEPTEEAESEPETDAAEEETTAEETAESSSTSEDESEDADSESSAAPAEGFLMGIDNPDESYTGTVVTMSDADRDYCERMVMGEAGGTGFTGMALVAQCIRDTFVSGGYGSVSEVISSNGYYGSTSITPSETCKEVVNYIFDQGGSAVQHRIQVFYASDICTSDWHEAQQFVCAYGYVRFFDV